MSIHYRGLCLYLAIIYFNIHTESLFVVGFLEKMYTVSEDDGQVEVCVTLIKSEGHISNETEVLVEVFNNTNPLNIPADAALASKSDHNKLSSRCCDFCMNGAPIEHVFLAHLLLL